MSFAAASFWRFASGAALAVAAAVAHAQPSEPNRTYNDRDAIIVAENFGYCTSFAYPALTREVLDTPLSHDAVFEMRALPERCVQDLDNWGGEVQRFTFPYPTFHAVLALGVLQHEEGPAVDLSSAPLLEPIPNSTPVDPHWLIMQRLGACLARSHPAEVLALVRARYQSSEERRARAALAPLIGQCIEPGATLRINTVELRWSVGLAYYRLRAALARSAPAAQQGTP